MLAQYCKPDSLKLQRNAAGLCWPPSLCIWPSPWVLHQLLGVKAGCAHVVSQDLVPCKARRTICWPPLLDEWRAQGCRMELGWGASPADAVRVAKQCPNTALLPTSTAVWGGLSPSVLVPANAPKLIFLLQLDVRQMLRGQVDITSKSRRLSSLHLLFCLHFLSPTLLRVFFCLLPVLYLFLHVSHLSGSRNSTVTTTHAAAKPSWQYFLLTSGEGDHYNMNPM